MVYLPAQLDLATCAGTYFQVAALGVVPNLIAAAKDVHSDPAL